MFTLYMIIFHDYFILTVTAHLVSNHILTKIFAFLYVIFMMSQIMAHS